MCSERAEVACSGEAQTHRDKSPIQAAAVISHNTEMDSQRIKALDIHICRGLIIQTASSCPYPSLLNAFWLLQPSHFLLHYLCYLPLPLPVAVR
ncbi:hypothetical protein QQF64_001584 [Cirrhinus molitorella]|uniref:Uncharacterized protein n=1 Tax=Cirrhinus molitorella TaxID=172907 RepID=A0ABR3P129_9TELE